MKLAKEKQI